MKILSIIGKGIDVLTSTEFMIGVLTGCGMIAIMLAMAVVNAL